MGISGKCKYSRASQLPFSKDQDGKPVSSTEQLKEAQFKHFANCELATVVESDSLVDDHIQLASHTVPPLPVIDNFMSPLQLEAGLLRTAKGKAVSTVVSSELIRLDPAQFTRLYHPLHVKCAFLCDEPIASKGAQAFAIKKKRKDHSHSGGFSFYHPEGPLH